MKILVTGATGFIGSAFARLALGRSHQIAALALPGEGLPRGLEERPGLVWLRGTLEDAPWGEIAGFGPEACLHAAWITTPGVYLESPENDRLRDSSINFVRELGRRGLRHLVALGTCIEYQLSNQPLAESTRIGPVTRYARCKDQLRSALEQESGAAGFAFSWARIFYPYGPGEHRARLCSALIEKLRRGERVELKTPQSTKDYIYIEDVGSAVLRVMEQCYRGAINVGTGVGVPVGELARRIGELLGRTDLVDEADPPEVDPFPFVVADISRLRSLGWRPRVSMPEGLRRLAASIPE